MPLSPLNTTFTSLGNLLPQGSRILVGLSGGIDSVVLLHGLQQHASHYGWQLSALHVHHGISANANQWADFCRDLCSEWQVPLTIRQVNIRPLRERLGIEAAARQLRHQALLAQDCDVIALAHHGDDQVETLLLQLLRGAGVRGASAMSLSSERYIRPLLGNTRRQIEDYAAQHQLRWIEDESNLDTQYPRNFLRHQLLPLLAQRFPDYRQTLLRSSSHFAEADQLLMELAAQDAEGAIHDRCLSLAVLRKLSPARAKNLLRYFLSQQQLPLPQTAQLEQIWQQLCFAREDAQLEIVLGAWQIRRYLDVLYLLPNFPPLNPHFECPWLGESQLVWPPLVNSIRFQAQIADGKTALLDQRKLTLPLTLRLRQGGETLQLQHNRPRHKLKKLLQEAQIPPWQRERWPLLFSGEQLVAVPGIGVAPEYQAAQGATGILLSL